MYSIVLSFQTAAIYFLSVFTKTNRMALRTPIIIISIFMVFYAIEPLRFNVWFDKISPAIEEGIAPENVATICLQGEIIE